MIFWKKQDVDITSAYDLKSSIATLQMGTETNHFNTIFQNNFVGKIKKDNVIIYYYRWFLGSPLRPQFVGKFNERDGKVSLNGKISLSFLLRYWLIAICLFLLILLFGVFNDAFSKFNSLPQIISHILLYKWFIVFIIFMVSLICILIYFGNKDYAKIYEFLKRKLTD